MHKVRSTIAKVGVHALRVSGFFDGYWQHWRGDLFDYAEKNGIHILPVHYYSPVPAKSDFARQRRKNNMAGVDLDVPAGLVRANTLLERYKEHFGSFLKSSRGYDPKNSGFHPLDAAILYAMVREVRPKRIIEIGSGMSTFVIAGALRDAGSTETAFTCIEPFVPEYLKANRDGITEIIEQPLRRKCLSTNFGSWEAQTTFYSLIQRMWFALTATSYTKFSKFSQS